MSRAENRHHDERIKAATRQRLRRREEAFYGQAEVPTPRHVGREARTPHPCSLWYCCGNCRLLYGETCQERRAPTIEDFDENP